VSDHDRLVVDVLTYRNEATYWQQRAETAEKERDEMRCECSVAENIIRAYVPEPFNPHEDATVIRWLQRYEARRVLARTEGGKP
jgi:hypothetical protein